MKKARLAFVGLCAATVVAWGVVALPTVGKARFVRRFAGVPVPVRLHGRPKARAYQFSAPPRTVLLAVKREMAASGFDMVTDTPELAQFVKNVSGEAVWFLAGGERITEPLPGTTCEVIFDTLL